METVNKTHYNQLISLFTECGHIRLRISGNAIMKNPKLIVLNHICMWFMNSNTIFKKLPPLMSSVCNSSLLNYPIKTIDLTLWEIPTMFQLLNIVIIVTLDSTSVLCNECRVGFNFCAL